VLFSGKFFHGPDNSKRCSLNKVSAFRRMKGMVFQTTLQFRRLFRHYLIPGMNAGVTDI